MAIGDTLKLTAVWKKSAASNACVNSFYFRQGTALILDTPEEDLWARFQNDALTDYRFQCSTALSLFHVYIGFAPNFLTTFQVDVTGVSGGESGDPLPARTAGILSYRSAEPGRRGKGRIFLPPTSESDNGGGAPTSAYVTGMNNFGDALMDMQGVSVAYALWFWQMWSPADQEAKDIIAHNGRGYWGSQRDRSAVLL